MKCQQCEKPATIHITDLVDGVSEVHLCENCAKDFLSPTQEEESPEVVPAMGGLLQQLAVSETAEELARLDERVCPVCGISFLEFRKQGRLGCPHDYTHFAEELEPLLINIHGEPTHVGKSPKHSGAHAEQQTQLIRLRREMKDAIATEDYERASQLRDEIKGIEESSAADSSAEEGPADATPPTEGESEGDRE
ncbi:MAG: UvrB/UvrC motif-containing protein [Planctomycetota bacterium]